MKTFTLAACIFCLIAGLASADSRNNAKEAIVKLKQSMKDQVNPDELNSIESTFLAADEFRLHNYLDMAERYYLLTIQKVGILLAVSPAQSLDLPLLVPPTSVYQTQSSAPPEASESVNTTRDSSESVPQTSEEPVEDTFTDNDYVPVEIESDKFVGRLSIYSIGKRDTLRMIAAKLGVSRQHLIQMNNLDPKVALKVGQKLKYNNRKIVPQRLKNGIIINIPDRTLYYFRNGKLITSLPVALGAVTKDTKYDWNTPTGKFTVTAKVKNPTWHVPHSIRTKMEREGKEVITSIPPGPRNPLGKYAIKTSLPGILIHSTTRPGSIYSFASHGCIRVYPEHMEQFFKEIRVNTHGEIIYHPVKLAITEDSRIFLEVHNDVYRKSAGLHALARQMIEKHNLSELVDWDKVKSVIVHKDGFAEDITL